MKFFVLGGSPKSLRVFDKASDEVKQRVTLFRSIVDFQELDAVASKAKKIVVIGGGFLGSELVCALGKKSTETIYTPSSRTLNI